MNINHKILISFLILQFLGHSYIQAQAPKFSWAKQSIGAMEGAKAVLDNSGNLYVVGYFKKTAVFDEVSLTSTAASSMFLVKYDASGIVQWALSAGGSESYEFCYGLGITLDDSDNIYVTGSFNYTATFGDISLTSQGNDDFFIAKYGASGDVQMAFNAGQGSDHQSGEGIAVDVTGNIYVTGNFRGTTTFGNLTLTNRVSEVFIAKYDPLGKVVWAQKVEGGSGYDRGKEVKVDGMGNIYMTGSFRDSATFGDITLNSVGYEDIFLAKYDGSGKIIWVKQAGGESNDGSAGLVIDGESNIYVTGSFIGTASFDDISLTSFGNSDMFTAKYDGTGSVIWVKQAGGEGDISYGGAYNDGLGIALDPSGNVYATGSFAELSTFGDLAVNDPLIVKYDTDGNVLWVKGAEVESEYFVYGSSIAVDDLGNSYLMGAIRGNAAFDGFKLSTEEWGMFVAKIENISKINIAPELSVPSSLVKVEGENIEFVVTATDEDSDDLQFSLIGNIPEGASIDGTSGLFSWTPMEDQGPATYTFNVNVSDGLLN